MIGIIGGYPGPDGLLGLRDDGLAQVVEFCGVDAHDRSVGAEGHGWQFAGVDPVADGLRVDAETARDLGRGQPIGGFLYHDAILAGVGEIHRTRFLRSGSRRSEGMPHSDIEPKNTRLDKSAGICYTMYRAENGPGGQQARTSAAPSQPGTPRGVLHMSAGLTNTDTLLSARNITPWHGLGVVLKRHPRSLEDALRKAS